MTDLKNRQMKTDTDNGYLKVLIPVLILITGIIIAAIIFITKPKPGKKRPDRLPPLVETLKAEAASHRIILSAMGTVVPSKSITIRPAVSGEIIMTSPEFVPGGNFKKGDIILKVDPADYRLAVRRTESLLNHAKAVFDLEMGHQEVAREELNLMQSTTGRSFKDTTLALRKPQLDQAKAQLDTSVVDLEIAKLNLKRTVIRAPFNALVTSKSADTGLQVSAQNTLGELVGIDAFWVEATVPVNQLQWITFPSATSKKGSDAVIETRTGDRYQGYTLKLSANLNEQSRLARVIVQIDDPMGISRLSESPPLLLGSYVRITFQGSHLDNTIALPRSVLRDDDRVWVCENGTLSIRSPEILWKSDEVFYISNGITHGEDIVISALTAPVEGMPLRIEAGRPDSSTVNSNDSGTK